MRKTRTCLMIVVVLLFMVTTLAGAQEHGTKKLNLNTATAGELTKVKGIGPKLAEKIVEYRKANGPFKKADDIVKVPGIGKKFWEANKNILTVDAAPVKGGKTQ